MSDPKLPPQGEDDAVELETEDLDGVDPDEEQEAGEEDDAEGDGQGDAGGPGDGDDAEGDDEAEGQARRVAAPARRSEGRYQRLANENRDLKRQQVEFQRQLQQLVAERRQPSPAELADQQRREDEAYELMSPAEQRRFTENKLRNEFNQQLGQTRGMLADRADKLEFDSLLAADPHLRRFEQEVEDLRPQTPGVPRKALLAYAIGMRALNGKGAAKTRAARGVAAQGERQRARPSNGRGDVRSERQRGGGSLEDRLRGVPI